MPGCQELQGQAWAVLVLVFMVFPKLLSMDRGWLGAADVLGQFSGDVWVGLWLVLGSHSCKWGWASSALEKSMLSQIIDLRSLRVPQSTSANKSSSLGTGTLSSS